MVSILCWITHILRNLGSQTTPYKMNGGSIECAVKMQFSILVHHLCLTSFDFSTISHYLVGSTHSHLGFSGAPLVDSPS
jgi:hypothetical protein